MGLDVLELVMRCEETFQVEIPETEAGDLTTVGALYDWLAARLVDGSVDRCSSTVWFYAVRRALLAAWGVERALVIPDMLLEQLIPAEGRAQAWQALGDALGAELPPLAWHRGHLLAVTGAGSLVPVAAVLAGLGSPAAAPLLLVGLAGTTAGWAIGHAHADLVPVTCRTVRDLVGHLVLRHPPADQRWSRQDLWDALVALISDQLDVDPGLVVREARWAHELGVA